MGSHLRRQFNGSSAFFPPSLAMPAPAYELLEGWQLTVAHPHAKFKTLHDKTLIYSPHYSPLSLTLTLFVHVLCWDSSAQIIEATESAKSGIGRFGNWLSFWIRIWDMACHGVDVLTRCCIGFVQALSRSCIGALRTSRASAGSWPRHVRRCREMSGGTGQLAAIHGTSSHIMAHVI